MYLFATEIFKPKESSLEYKCGCWGSFSSCSCPKPIETSGPLAGETLEVSLRNLADSSQSSRFGIEKHYFPLVIVCEPAVSAQKLFADVHVTQLEFYDGLRGGLNVNTISQKQLINGVLFLINKIRIDTESFTLNNDPMWRHLGGLLALPCGHLTDACGKCSEMNGSCIDAEVKGKIEIRFCDPSSREPIPFEDVFSDRSSSNSNQSVSRRHYSCYNNES